MFVAFRSTGEVKTHTEAFCNGHLLAVRKVVNVSKGSKFHGRGTGGHEHHGKPKHGVGREQGGTGGNGVDDGDGDSGGWSRSQRVSDCLSYAFIRDKEMQAAVGGIPKNLEGEDIRSMTYSGHTTNRVPSTKIAGPNGTFPLSSPLFIFLKLELSFTPTTTTCKLANSPPTFARLSVSHALKMPPSCDLLKKARWSGGTSPMVPPRRAPMKGALRKE